MASAANINALNQQLRSSPEYAQWMRGQGIDPSKPIRLSDQQRTALATYLRGVGWSIPKGAEIDKAGNINENEGFGKQLKKWGPVAGQVGLGIATGGMSLPASMAINAGAGAGLGAAGMGPGGGGWKGAALGAGIGAGSAYGGRLLRNAMGGPSPASEIAGLDKQIGRMGAGGWANAAGGAAGVAGAGGGGMRDAVGDIAGGAARGGMNAWQTAALAAMAGLPGLLANRGMSDEERRIYDLLRGDLEEARGDREADRSFRSTQLRRMQYQDPLYQAVNQLAMSRLPTGVQRPMGDL